MASIAGLVYLIALCLHRDAHYLIFELSQVYAWQTTAMLLGWWALRRFFDRCLSSAEGHHAWSQWAWLLAAFGFSYLAIWSSVASALFLYLLLALEGVRAWSRQSPPPRFRAVLRACALGFVAIAAATAIERLQKMAYRRFSIEHYGSPFSTEFALDTGHLADNLAVQLRLIGHLFLVATGRARHCAGTRPRHHGDILCDPQERRGSCAAAIRAR